MKLSWAVTMFTDFYQPVLCRSSINSLLYFSYGGDKASLHTKPVTYLCSLTQSRNSFLHRLAQAIHHFWQPKVMETCIAKNTSQIYLTYFLEMAAQCIPSGKQAIHPESNWLVFYHENDVYQLSLLETHFFNQRQPFTLKYLFFKCHFLKDLGD